MAVAAQEALLSRLSQSQEACEHLKEQLEALRRHSLSLQESCTRLQTLNTQLQVNKQTQIKTRIMAEFNKLVHLNVLVIRVLRFIELLTWLLTLRLQLCTSHCAWIIFVDDAFLLKMTPITKKARV